jgi:hypothetical protein
MGADWPLRTTLSTNLRRFSHDFEELLLSFSRAFVTLIHFYRHSMTKGVTKMSFKVITKECDDDDTISWSRICQSGRQRLSRLKCDREFDRGVKLWKSPRLSRNWVSGWIGNEYGYNVQRETDVWFANVGLCKSLQAKDVDAIPSSDLCWGGDNNILNGSQNARRFSNSIKHVRNAGITEFLDL